jgi:threonine/homoserine/homoserine lactone efflux protein
MPESQWLALALFSFVSSITPGPNNLLATSSGARFGLRRTLPQVAGVTFGFTLLLGLAASGVAALAQSSPTATAVLAIVGYGYLAWLAFRLIAAGWGPSHGLAMASVLRPMTFWQSAAFQFANPKAWMMALAAATSFLGGSDGSLATAIGLGAVFAAINFPCVASWALLGSRLRGWLGDPRRPWRMRAFDVSMGCLLVATLVWMIHRS